MIFENELNIPCVNDLIGFLAVWLNACVSNWNDKKHALSHFFLLDGFAWE